MNPEIRIQIGNLAGGCYGRLCILDHLARCELEIVGDQSAVDCPLSQKEFGNVVMASHVSPGHVGASLRAGAMSHKAIAAKLNERNVKTARGGTWTHVQVGAILHPFEGASVGAA
jgi:hypothetical protein